MPRQRIRRWLLRICGLIGIFIISAAIGIAIFFTRCSHSDSRFTRLAQSPYTPQLTAGIKDYSRPQEDTYFTYPEWYIVWSYQEKSDYQQAHLPSAFPYFGAIGQYWEAYCWANSMAASGQYPFDFGDHLMLMVIGSSFSVEYALKGAYEITTGRFSEWTSNGQMVAEDHFAAAVAKNYADFVHIRPFYEFSFGNSLRGLWRETSWSGPHLFRKIERRLFLSLDYAIEALYCAALTGLTHAAYGVEPADTYATVETTSARILTQNPHVQVLRQPPAEISIIRIPRYQEFTATASRFAESSVRFRDIAGNREVLVSVIVPIGMAYVVPDGQLVFTSQILTEAERKRIGIRCMVGNLGEVINSIAARGWKLEHVYDF